MREQHNTHRPTKTQQHKNKHKNKDYSESDLKTFANANNDTTVYTRNNLNLEALNRFAGYYVMCGVKYELVKSAEIAVVLRPYF